MGQCVQHSDANAIVVLHGPSDEVGSDESGPPVTTIFPICFPVVSFGDFVGCGDAVVLAFDASSSNCKDNDGSICSQ